MKLRNDLTGDILEVPPPQEMGDSVILLNGKVLFRVLYSDEDDSVTLHDGRKFRSGGAFAKFLIEELRKYGNKIEQ